MKKSFLKRVTAAIVAVPVALTQTALFTSFAAGETSNDKDLVVTIDSVIGIDTDGKTLIPAADFDGLSGFTAKELSNENAFVQVGAWNQKLMNRINEYEAGGEHHNGHYTIECSRLADAEESDMYRHRVIAEMLASEGTKATVDIVDQHVILSVNYDFNYAESLRKQIESHLQEQGVDIVIPANYVKESDNLNGFLVVDISAEELAENGVLTAEASLTDVNTKTEIKGISELEDYLDDAHKYALFAAAADAKTAAGEDEALQAMVDEYVLAMNEQFENYMNKFDGIGDTVHSVSWTTGDRAAADMDEFLGRWKEKWDKAPASLEAIKTNRWYHRLEKGVNALLDQIDEQSASVRVDITADDVMDFAEGAYDIYAELEANINKDEQIYNGGGSVLYYVDDEDVDYAAYKAYFEDQYGEELAAEGLAVGDVDSVKVVEGAAVVDGGTQFTGAAGMDVYRIVWFETVEATEETTTTTAETTTSNSETTTTESGEKASETTTTTESGEKASETTTTTTGEGTTTTSETTTTQTETQPKTPTHVEGEVDMQVELINEGAGSKFFFAHDDRAIDMTKIVAEGAKNKESEEAVDYSKFTLGAYGATMNGVEDFGEVTPAEIYAKAQENGDTYAALQFSLMYNGEAVTTGREYDENGEITKAGELVHVTIYVGVKGDLNLDGNCDSKDGTRALIHATQVGTGVENARKFTAFNDVTDKLPTSEVLLQDMEAFMMFLGDVDTETDKGEDIEKEIVIGARDAQKMFVFAARHANDDFGTRWINDAGVTIKDAEGKDYTFERKGVLTSNYPAYSKAIAESKGLLKEEEEA